MGEMQGNWEKKEAFSVWLIEKVLACCFGVWFLKTFEGKGKKKETEIWKNIVKNVTGLKWWEPTFDNL